MVNNFDFLRLLFEILVIVTHSYPLSGDESFDALFTVTGGNLQFSYIAVKGFFIISVYLIFQSLLRSETFGRFIGIGKKAITLINQVGTKIADLSYLLKLLVDKSLKYKRNVI